MEFLREKSGHAATQGHFFFIFRLKFTNELGCSEIFNGDCTFSTGVCYFYFYYFYGKGYLGHLVMVIIKVLIAYLIFVVAHVALGS